MHSVPKLDALCKFGIKGTMVFAPFGYPTHSSSVLLDSFSSVVVLRVPSIVIYLGTFVKANSADINVAGDKNIIIIDSNRPVTPIEAVTRPAKILRMVFGRNESPREYELITLYRLRYLVYVLRMPIDRLPRRATIEWWKRARRDQTMTWRRSLKVIASKFSCVGHCRLPGWGLRDGTHHGYRYSDDNSESWGSECLPEHSQMDTEYADDVTLVCQIPRRLRSANQYGEQVCLPGQLRRFRWVRWRRGQFSRRERQLLQIDDTNGAGVIIGDSNISVDTDASLPVGYRTARNCAKESNVLEATWGFPVGWNKQQAGNERFQIEPGRMVHWVAEQGTVYEKSTSQLGCCSLPHVIGSGIQRTLKQDWSTPLANRPDAEQASGRIFRPITCFLVVETPNSHCSQKVRDRAVSHLTCLAFLAKQPSVNAQGVLTPKARSETHAKRRHSGHPLEAALATGIQRILNNDWLLGLPFQPIRALLDAGPASCLII
ncbi:endonuclease-reverse transcriptase [Clonorchis sinensis]|uniref:Endonuclease-reverse transcriptase n=1 Tax=Clonorchis sinensis TaxID=79923 RepID=G7YH11_CLOSI|nr:endonuclease-reverse transcriptase [Clonorchis sinensis]